MHTKPHTDGIQYNLRVKLIFQNTKSLVENTKYLLTIYSKIVKDQSCVIQVGCTKFFSYTCKFASCEKETAKKNHLFHLEHS